MRFTAQTPHLFLIYTVNNASESIKTAESILLLCDFLFYPNAII